MILNSCMSSKQNSGNFYTALMKYAPSSKLTFTDTETAELPLLRSFKCEDIDYLMISLQGLSGNNGGAVQTFYICTQSGNRLGLGCSPDGYYNPWSIRQEWYRVDGGWIQTISNTTLTSANDYNLAKTYCNELISDETEEITSLTLKCINSGHSVTMSTYWQVMMAHFI